MCMRGLGYAPSTISDYWLNSGLTRLRTLTSAMLQSIQIIPFYETCYLLMETRVN